MNETSQVAAKGERPIAITVFCIIGIGLIVLSLVAVPNIADLLTEKVGGWYVPFLIASLLITLACFIGYWMMKRWGVYLYTAIFAIGTAVSVFFGLPVSLPGLIVPVLVIILGFAYIKRMN
jgi:hypothetical protein